MCISSERSSGCLLGSIVGDFAFGNGMLLSSGSGVMPHNVTKAPIRDGSSSSWWARVDASL